MGYEYMSLLDTVSTLSKAIDVLYCYSKIRCGHHLLMMFAAFPLVG